MSHCRRNIQGTPGACLDCFLKHMYDTRAAADGWQQEYSSFHKSIGIVQGVASPYIFGYNENNVSTSVHGDDFTSVGAKCNLDWLEKLMEAKYELRKGGRLGPGKDDAKEILVFNRVIRYTDHGLEYTADPDKQSDFSNDSSSTAVGTRLQRQA